jgi:hypothetical protein
MSGNLVWLFGIILPQLAIGVTSCIALKVLLRKKESGDSTVLPQAIFTIGSIVFVVLNVVFSDKRNISILAVFVAAVLALISSHSTKKPIEVISLILAFAMLGVAIWNEVEFYKNYDSNIIVTGESVVTKTNIELVPVNKNSMVVKSDKYGGTYKYAYISESGEKQFDTALASYTNVHYIGENEKPYLIKTVEDAPAKNTNFYTQWEITKETTRHELYIQAEEIGME